MNTKNHRSHLRAIILSFAVAMTLAWPNPGMASVYGPAPYIENLLANPNGDKGDLSGWTITSNGGDGWYVHMGYHQGHPEDNGFLTSFNWAKREQVVDLLAKGFTAEFLDTAPTILISEMFEKVFCADKFFLSIDLLDSNYNIIRTWASGEQQHRNTSCDYSGYKDQVSAELTHYGPGLRYIRWRDGGKDSELWRGHFGPKLQNAYLAIAPANLLNNPDDLPSWTILQSGGDGFLVTGPPDARQFMTSYDWGRRQQTIDLLAMGFTANELDSGLLPILAKGTYGERACPDKYYLKVELLDQNYQVLSTSDSGVRTHDGECDWTYSGYAQTIHHQFVNYPPGVRYIRWEDGGMDSEYWAGHFGATLQAPYLAIVNYRSSSGSLNVHGRMLSVGDYFPAILWSASAFAVAGLACAGSFGTLCPVALGTAVALTVADTAFVVAAEGTTSKVKIEPVRPQPTDPQVTPECDASCKLDKISLGLADLAQPSLWSVDRISSSNDVQIFSGPKYWEPDLQVPGNELKQAVRETIAKGTKLIDITTLASITYPWTDAIAAALKEVEVKAFNQHGAPIVRIHLGLYGHPLGGDYPRSGWDDHLAFVLNEITKGLAGNSSMTVYISGGRSVTNWNHSKIVAVDGKEVITGGHNLWSIYFDQLPVFDVSLKVTGDSAMSAHRFVDKIWSIHYDNFPHTTTHVHKWHGGVIAKNVSTRPPYSSFLGNISNSSNGPISVLGVGQDNQTGHESPLQRAVLNMVGAATQSIYISQQALAHPSFSFVVDQNVATSLAKKAIAGVSVEIVLSNIDAPHNTRSHVENKKLLQLLWSAAVMNGVQDGTYNRQEFCKNLSLSSLRVPNRSESFANHAKTILIDKQVFLVGSHNLYSQWPVQLSEYAYVVADPSKAQVFFDTYWHPLLDTARVIQLDCVHAVDNEL